MELHQIMEGGEVITEVRPIVAEQQGGENAKIARARRALERIRNVGRDRSEKLWYRVDDMVDEADDALRFLAL